jgi:hypothetical protein
LNCTIVLNSFPSTSTLYSSMMFELTHTHSCNFVNQDILFFVEWSPSTLESSCAFQGLITGRSSFARDVNHHCGGTRRNKMFWC